LRLPFRSFFNHLTSLVEACSPPQPFLFEYQSSLSVLLSDPAVKLLRTVAQVLCCCTGGSPKAFTLFFSSAPNSFVLGLRPPSCLHPPINLLARAPAFLAWICYQKAPANTPPPPTPPPPHLTRTLDPALFWSCSEFVFPPDIPQPLPSPQRCIVLSDLFESTIHRTVPFFVGTTLIFFKPPPSPPPKRSFPPPKRTRPLPLPTCLCRCGMHADSFTQTVLPQFENFSDEGTFGYGSLRHRSSVIKVAGCKAGFTPVCRHDGPDFGWLCLPFRP